METVETCEQCDWWKLQQDKADGDDWRALRYPSERGTAKFPDRVLRDGNMVDAPSKHMVRRRMARGLARHLDIYHPSGRKPRVLDAPAPEGAAEKAEVRG